MRTPSTRQCSYYYEDFNRGADIRQCRIARSKGSEWWRASDCAKCPVPTIESASGSPYLDLTLTVVSGRLPWRRHFGVQAWCLLHGPIEDPYVGCLECVGEVDLGEG
jgi:hypothetical protein